jgi:hypothetical protein
MNTSKNVIKKNPHLQNTIQTINQNHVISFLIIIITLQSIGVYISTKTKYDTSPFRIPLVIGTYVYLTQQITPIQYLTSGLICSVLAFIIFKLCCKVFNSIIIETITIFCIIFAMLFVNNLVHIASIAYAMTGITLIPKLGYNYILYYLYGILFVIALVQILTLIHNNLLPNSVKSKILTIPNKINL